MSKKHDETADDIEWIEIEVPGEDDKQRACSVGDARLYLGVSGPGMNLILRDNDVTRWTYGHGSTKYVLERDLEKIKRLRQQVRPSGGRTSMKSLLAEAAVLFEQTRDGHADTEAIGKWLRMYREIE